MDLTTAKIVRKRKPGAIDVGNMMLGKVPPQAKDLEEAVLGSILNDKRYFDIAIEILRPECFYVQSHQTIFQAMFNLFNQKFPIDLLTVSEELKKIEKLDEVGGPFALVKLTNTKHVNVEFYCKIIFQKYMAREIIKISGELISLAYEDSTDPFDLVDLAEKNILNINPISKPTYKKADQAIFEVIKKIDELRHSKEELTGINTGYTDINNLTCGWQQPDLIILAARPSVGKTALALNFALASCQAGKGVGFFSLEMSTMQLMQRVTSIMSGFLLKDIIRGRLSEDQMEQIYKDTSVEIAKLNLFIDDTPGPTIYELRNKARKMVKEGAGILIIDYIQLMSGIQNGRADNREQEISKISRDLKGLAKELEIPIIALSQLSREVERHGRKSKMPVLSDLRESGAIEQDADIVAFIYRPEYYGELVDENGNKYNGETHVRFAKHRSGALDTIRLRANLEIQKFYDFVKEPVQLGIKANSKLNVNDGVADLSDTKYF